MRKQRPDGNSTTSKERCRGTLIISLHVDNCVALCSITDTRGPEQTIPQDLESWDPPGHTGVYKPRLPHAEFLAADRQLCPTVAFSNWQPQKVTLRGSQQNIIPSVCVTWRWGGEKKSPKWSGKLSSFTTWQMSLRDIWAYENGKRGQDGSQIQSSDTLY